MMQIESTGVSHIAIDVHSEALGNLWLSPPDVQPTSASAAYVLGELC